MFSYLVTMSKSFCSGDFLSFSVEKNKRRWAGQMRMHFVNFETAVLTSLS